MATLTLSPKKNAQVPVKELPVQQVEVATTAEIEPITSTELAVPTAHISSGCIEGEITTHDLKVPRLNLAQKSGKLGDDFPPGSFVFEQQVLIANPGSSFVAVPLRMKKYYQEKVEFGTDQIPRKANTSAEVRSLGGTTNYDLKDELPWFQDIADIRLAIQAPDDLDEQYSEFFPYSDGTNNYALAIYTVASSAYTSLAKRFITDGEYLLKGALYSGRYEISGELRKGANNSWYVPVGKFISKNTEDQSEFFRGLAGI
jgi:hypothetical protein